MNPPKNRKRRFNCASWASCSLVSCPAAPDDDSHASNRDNNPRDIPRCNRNAINFPQPHQRYRDVDTAVCGVHAPRCRRMQRQEPRKQRKTQECREKQPSRAVLPKPQIWQIAADDFGDGGDNEQSERFQDQQAQLLRLCERLRAVREMSAGESEHSSTRTQPHSRLSSNAPRIR